MRASWACFPLLLATLALAPAASAHATLLVTRPGNDTAVASAPREVRLHFDEPVVTSLGAVRVYDSSARRVDNGDVSRPEGSDVVVGLRAGLPADTYTVTWRVISADSHPVRGAFVFHVGTPKPGQSSVVSKVLDAEGGSRVVTDVFPVVRFVGLLLTLLCVGGTVMAAYALRGRPEHAKVTWVGVASTAGLLAVASLLWIGFEGAEAAGLGPGSVFDRSLFREVVSTDFGTVWLARVFVSVALLAAAIVAGRTGMARTAATVVAVGAAASIAAAPALSGHARVAGPITMIGDWVHVLAAGVWVGGLAFLLLALVQAGGDRWSLAAYVVPRFSPLALLSVALLVTAGVVSGLSEVHSVSALWNTTYGRLLLVKIALLVPLLVLGAFNNRRSVPALRSANASATARRRFLQVAAVELVLMAVIVGVTAALIAERPAKAASSIRSVSVRSHAGPFDLDLEVDPASTGANEMHLYVLSRSTGQPVDVDEVRVAASLPAAAIGPLEFTATPAGPGHTVVAAATFPLAGEWRLLVTVRKGDFDEWATTLLIPIRKDTQSS